MSITILTQKEKFFSATFNVEMQSVLMRMKCCDRFTDCSDGSDEVGKCTFVASPLKSEDLAGIIIIYNKNYCQGLCARRIYT